MPDLITLARAKQMIGWDASFSTADDAALEDFIDATSAAIEAYCRKCFTSTQFDELYDGTGFDRLLLRQYPVIGVERVATNRTSVLQIQNTSPANQRATVAVTSAGLTLVRVASGVVTTDTSVTFAGNVTLAAVAAAVNALGNGWYAAAMASESLRASADLRDIQGAVSCRQLPAYLQLHIDDLNDYEVDAEKGWLVREVQDTFDDDWSAHVGGFPRGSNRYRVIYTAGYATVPEDVQEACALWVADLYESRAHQPNYQALASNTTASGQSEAWYQQKPMPARVRQLLEPHRKHTR